MKKREHLFSITQKDFIIQPFKGSGKGGQHRNKTMSCIRIKHPESGAEVIATESRHQKQNKDLAFERIVKHSKFKRWLKIKAAEQCSSGQSIEGWVEEQMKSENLEIYYGSEDKKQKKK